MYQFFDNLKTIKILMGVLEAGSIVLDASLHLPRRKENEKINGHQNDPNQMKI